MYGKEEVFLISGLDGGMVVSGQFYDLDILPREKSPWYPLGRMLDGH
jgi:hypothetical protein